MHGSTVRRGAILLPLSPVSLCGRRAGGVMPARMPTLAPGAGIRLNGVEWTLEDVQPRAGGVVLREMPQERWNAA